VFVSHLWAKKRETPPAPSYEEGEIEKFPSYEEGIKGCSYPICGQKRGEHPLPPLTKRGR